MFLTEVKITVTLILPSKTRICNFFFLRHRLVLEKLMEDTVRNVLMILRLKSSQSV